MSIAASPPGLQPEDFEEIDAAVRETERGRWFLREFERRLRAAENDSLRAALARIEARLDALGAPPSTKAAFVIERLSDLVWKLRESGVDDFVCAKIERLARDLEIGDAFVETGAAAPTSELVFPAFSVAATARLGDFVLTPFAESHSTETQTAKEAPTNIDVVAVETRDRGLSVDRVDEDGAAPSDHEVSSTIGQAPPPLDPRLEALLWLDRLPLLDRMALFA